MNKYLNHLRVKLIEILSGEDLCIAVNLKLNEGSSLLLESNKYYFFRNVEINDKKGDVE
jgi:hypothetical protein